MLQFDSIKQLCINALLQNINANNCLRTWFLCDQLDIHPLAEKAKCKSLIEFNSIRETDSIFMLNIQELHSYLANVQLHCDSELDVFETAIKWWYEFTKKDNCDNEDKTVTKYFLIFLRCLDYSSMTKLDINNMFLISPELSSNEFIKNIFTSIDLLVENKQVSDVTHEERIAVELFTNCRKRCRKYLPCIVCNEYNEHMDKPKRQKYLSCNCVKTVNVYYYGKIYLFWFFLNSRIFMT